MRVLPALVAVLALAGHLPNPRYYSALAGPIDYSLSLGPMEIESESDSPASSDSSVSDSSVRAIVEPREATDAAIRAALGSGKLACPAFALGSGASSDSPMIPYIESTDCDTSLATLRFGNGSAFPSSNFQACNSQDRFQILNPTNGTWVTAPDYSLFTLPTGVTNPQLDMNFYATGKALQRRNCNSGSQTGSAPPYYTASLQGQLLRLLVTCNNGGYSGYVYFAVSRR